LSVTVGKEPEEGIPLRTC